MTDRSNVAVMGERAARAAKALRNASSQQKDNALRAMAAALLDHSKSILDANAADVEAAKLAGATDAVLDRLRLDEKRLEGVSKGITTVVGLPDPVGVVHEGRTLPNGLVLQRVAVPFGVIAAIYENRPNVTADIACLCFKAGSATILRGGREALRSNIAIGNAISHALKTTGFSEDAVQVVTTEDRQIVTDLLNAREYIDLVIPRGGESLIKLVCDNAKMPVLAGGAGVCHVYVDRSADLESAINVVVNAKTRRFSTCNALDTLVVHAGIAPALLPGLAQALAEKKTVMKCDAQAYAIVAKQPNAEQSVDSDFGHEWLSPVLSVKTVATADEGIEFIQEHSSGHSDCIMSNDLALAMRFTREIDTAVCYVNASTQFTDGGQFGMGAEIIDSTQKFHARGPVGLQEICTYRWIVFGNGQIRSAT